MVRVGPHRSRKKFFSIAAHPKSDVICRSAFIIHMRCHSILCVTKQNALQKMTTRFVFDMVNDDPTAMFK